jgi:hypothetical protein
MESLDRSDSPRSDSPAKSNSPARSNSTLDAQRELAAIVSRLHVGALVGSNIAMGIAVSFTDQFWPLPVSICVSILWLSSPRWAGRWARSPRSLETIASRSFAFLTLIASAPLSFHAPLGPSLIAVIANLAAYDMWFFRYRFFGEHSNVASHFVMRRMKVLFAACGLGAVAASGSRVASITLDWWVIAVLIVAAIATLRNSFRAYSQSSSQRSRE